MKSTGIISLTFVYFESTLVNCSVLPVKIQTYSFRSSVHLPLRVSDSFTENWIRHLDIYESSVFKLWEAIYLINSYENN